MHSAALGGHSHNAGSGISFALALADYASDDPAVITALSSVIDGPGFFAVVDCWDPLINQMSRVLAFGGSELMLKSL